MSGRTLCHSMLLNGKTKSSLLGHVLHLEDSILVHEHSEL